MNINRALGYTLLTIATIGFSQVIGACGLFFTACKATYDCIQYARYLKLYEQAIKLNPALTKTSPHLEKMEHYGRRKEDNIIYAKAFTASLVSLSLNHRLGYMEKSFAAMVSDVFFAIYSPECIRQKVFSLNGKSTYDPMDEGDFKPDLIRESMIKEWGAEKGLIASGEDSDRKFDAIWIPSNSGKHFSQCPTVIVIPGRASILEHNKDYAEYYRNKGLNVLMYSPTGYPGSFPLGFKTTELSLYEDAEAAIAYIKRYCKCETSDIPYSNDRVLFHGISIGSAAAVDAASRYKGSHLITEIAFSKGQDAAERYLVNSLPSFIFTHDVVGRLVKDLARTVFPIQPHLKFQLTSFDNTEKITEVTGRYLSIYRKADVLMDLLCKTHNGFSRKPKTRNSAVTLLKAYNNRRQAKGVRACRVKCEGGHVLGSVKFDQVSKALDEFLHNIEFV